jgi:hypothetical protein
MVDVHRQNEACHMGGAVHVTTLSPGATASDAVTVWGVGV